MIVVCMDLHDVILHLMRASYYLGRWLEDIVSGLQNAV